MSLFLDKEREGSVLCLCYHTQCEQYGGKAKMGKCRLLASELNIYALSVLIYSQGAPFSGRKAAKVVTSTLRPTLRLKPDSSPTRNNNHYNLSEDSDLHALNLDWQ